LSPCEGLAGRPGLCVCGAFGERRRVGWGKREEVRRGCSRFLRVWVWVWVRRTAGLGCVCEVLRFVCEGVCGVFKGWRACESLRKRERESAKEGDGGARSRTAAATRTRCSALDARAPLHLDTHTHTYTTHSLALTTTPFASPSGAIHPGDARTHRIQRRHVSTEKASHDTSARATTQTQTQQRAYGNPSTTTTTTTTNGGTSSSSPFLLRTSGNDRWWPRGRRRRR